MKSYRRQRLTFADKQYNNLAKKMCVNLMVLVNLEGCNKMPGSYSCGYSEKIYYALDRLGGISWR